MIGPAWLEMLSHIWLTLSGLSAVIIFCDIKIFRPQPMQIMTVAWPVNALYFGIAGLIFYFWFGRAPFSSVAMSHHHHSSSSLTWKNIFKTSTHCGTGCTIADIMGEIIMLFFPVYFMGNIIFGGWILDFVLALLVGLYFQYLPNRQMGMSKPESLKKAIKADILSLTAWQAGMYIWMALVFFVFFTPHLNRFSAVYWFMMQIAMIIGFLFAYPVNRFLIEKGIKHVM